MKPKYCIDCQHVRVSIPRAGNTYYCNMVPGPVSLVTGRPEYYVQATVARSDEGPCGPKARLFLANMKFCI